MAHSTAPRQRDKMVSAQTRKNRREAWHWKDAAEEALRYAEAKMEKEDHKDMLPPAINGDLWRTTLLINEYGKKGYECKYNSQSQRRFIEKLHQFNERLLKIKNECSKRNGACIDCNNGMHPVGHCPDKDPEEVDPWATTDESEDSETDLVSDRASNGGEETVEEWFWRTQRIRF